MTAHQVIDVSHGQLVYRSHLAEKTANTPTALPAGGTTAVVAALRRRAAAGTMGERDTLS